MALLKPFIRDIGYNENLLLSAPASAHTLSFTWAREVVGNGLIYAYAESADSYSTACAYVSRNP
mgnify:CR=1 FL=1